MPNTSYGNQHGAGIRERAKDQGEKVDFGAAMTPGNDGEEQPPRFI
jgi:hypothetical protein